MEFQELHLPWLYCMKQIYNSVRNIETSRRMQMNHIIDIKTIGKGLVLLHWRQDSPIGIDGPAVIISIPNPIPSGKRWPTLLLMYLKGTTS